MLEKVFETRAHAKCILAGEHSVIYGFPALVTPIAEKFIVLSYEYSDTSLRLESDDKENFEKFFTVTFQQALHVLNKEISDIQGTFFIRNNIPIGAGIGFSAAFCVAITRWLIWKKWLDANQLFSFAKQLENIFHGKSSGVDIAGAMAHHVTHFEPSGKIYEIQEVWKPKLYLSNSGLQKNTAVAVANVKKIRDGEPKLADRIDERMKKSVSMIEKSLMIAEKDGSALLASGISYACSCFEEWGLITPKLSEHMHTLQELGAIAVKPTGAGIGGYVLSLWQKNPPENSDIKFTAIFD